MISTTKAAATMCALTCTVSCSAAMCRKLARYCRGSQTDSCAGNARDKQPCFSAAQSWLVIVGAARLTVVLAMLETSNHVSVQLCAHSWHVTVGAARLTVVLAMLETSNHVSVQLCAQSWHVTVGAATLNKITINRDFSLEYDQTSKRFNRPESLNSIPSSF